MQIGDFAFGSIRIDGITHEHDVVIEGGEIRKRTKKPSKKFREEFGHTPLSVEEDIPWKCRLAGNRYRSLRQTACDAGNKARSRASQSRTGHRSHGGCH
jgi:hypothetical protein